MRSTALIISALLHGAMLVGVVYGDALLAPPTDDAIVIVDAEIISSEDFDALTAPPPTRDAPEVIEQLASLTAPSAPDPVTPDAPPPAPADAPAPLLVEEDLTTPPAPELELEDQDPPDSDAPYAAAPATPAPLIVNAQSLQDRSADEAIREALAPVRAAQAPGPQIANASPVSAPEPVRDAAPVADAPDTPPEPEPEQAPEPETAPEPEPTETPEQEIAEDAAAPVAALAPRRRPARPADDQPKVEVAKEQPDFLAKLAKAVEDSNQAQPQARPRPQSQRRPGRQLSARERQGFVLALNRCWVRPDLGLEDPSGLLVSLQLELDQQGRIVGRPMLLRPTGALSFKQNVFYRSALAAVERCQPFQLPADKYDTWASIILDFDPSQTVVGVQ